MALSAPGDGNEGGGDPTVTTLLGSWGAPQGSSNITRVEYELYEDGSSLGVRGTAVDATTEFEAYGPDPNAPFETNVGSTYKFRARFANGTYTGDWSSFSNTITVNT
jgi:hypothetical protein